MALNRYLVDSIIEEVRLICGEDNRSGSISDELVLRLLNSAQEEAAQLLARKYPEPLLTYTDIPLTSEIDYDIPEDAFEERVLKCEVIQGNNVAPWPVLRVDYNDDLLAGYSEEQVSSTPEVWFQIGSTRSIRVLPKPQPGYTLRMWYAKKPDDLVVSQGKIKALTNATTIQLDEIGEDITNDQDQDGSHLSVIDGQTGIRKAVLRVASTNSTANTVTFASTIASGTVTEIEGITIDVPDFTTQKIAIGDYVCIAPYTCLPSIRVPLVRYIVQYAIALVQVNLGAEHQVAFQALQKMQQFVEGMDTGKQNIKRVHMKSEALGGFYKRRSVYPRSNS